MAHNWKVTPRKLSVLKILDALLLPFRARKNVGVKIDTSNIKSILVVEIWRLGDTILATPMLRLVRKRFPGAKITLLCKPHSKELLAGTGLVDEFVHFDFPWTAETGKYNASKYKLFVL